MESVLGAHCNVPSKRALSWFTDISCSITGMDSQSLDLAVVLVGTGPRLDLIPAGPGRLLTKAYLTGGHVMEKKFNRLVHKLGLGPEAVAKRINDRLEQVSSEGLRVLLSRITESRQSNESNPDHLAVADKHSRELEKDCMKLMKHALPFVLFHRP
jgi:hypothetical protein